MSSTSDERVWLEPPPEEPDGRTVLHETPYYVAYIVRGETNRVLVEPKDDEIATDATHPRPPSLVSRCGFEPDRSMYEVPDPAKVGGAYLNHKYELGKLIEKTVKEDVFAAKKEWDVQNYRTTLLCYPKGYKFYMTKPGVKALPHRVIGSPNSFMFRGSDRFAPHLAWLMRGQPKNADGSRTCKCEHCPAKGPSRTRDAELRGRKSALSVRDTRKGRRTRWSPGPRASNTPGPSGDAPDAMRDK